MRSRGPVEGPGPGVPPDGPAPAIRVVDHLQGRVRRPVDLLRCLADLIQVALAIGIGLAAYALVSLLASQASVLGLVIALLLGRVVGLGVRYIAGYQARRPAAAEIALALGPAGRGITDMLRLPGREAGARRYAAILDDGRRLDIMVLDRDQQA